MQNGKFNFSIETKICEKDDDTLNKIVVFRMLRMNCILKIASSLNVCHRDFLFMIADSCWWNVFKIKGNRVMNTIRVKYMRINNKGRPQNKLPCEIILSCLVIPIFFSTDYLGYLGLRVTFHFPAPSSIPLLQRRSFHLFLTYMIVIYNQSLLISHCFDRSRKNHKPI